ncbi:hypothetical protein [Ketobacter sp.]|uniref:hypothetical protein n=1 Tax=Ketobacter sp. TaxID=2083498 RepID=UPI000F1DAF35|nr:hypothetical protein [Ketobacter sp.]RLT97337.1 MAG: hypothetical protein D9N14_11125 [Ketobacter sp.]
MRIHNVLKTMGICSGWLLCGPVSAYYAYELPTASAYDLELNTGMGNSQGTLQWNIAGGNDGPNILSELTYKDVNFRQFTMASTLRLHRGWLAQHEVFASFSHGAANQGTVQDSDYDGDNRSGEYSRSYSSAVDSKMTDFSLGLARRVQLDAFQVIKPMVGFSRKTQNMLMTEGVQTINTDDPAAIGPFRGTLNSSYDTTWDSLWLGLGWSLETRHHQLGLAARFEWLDYSAVADWNLRSDFAHPKSFSQRATGNGYSVSLDYSYHFNQTISMWLSWQQKDWKTDPGQDTVYFADGSRGSTQLNEVSWQESGISTGMILRF